MSKKNTLNALAVIQATEDALKSSYEQGDPYAFEEHFLKGLKKAGKKVKNAIKKVGDKIVDKVKKVAGNVLLAPLLPFKGAMKKALKKKGISPPNDLPALASKFYQVVIQKKSNFEYCYELEDDLNHVDPVVTPMIITAIVGFIKQILGAKLEGKKLTAEEQEIAEQVETDTRNLVTEQTTQDGTTAPDGNAPTSGGGGGGIFAGGFDIGKFLPIILIAVVGLVVLKK